jgi:ferritin-like metal-binding protein YciE
MEQLRQLFTRELQDLLHAEMQLVQALPKNGRSRASSQTSGNFQ